MTACTAVVTEISYRDQSGISALVDFLSMQEWTSEISVLLEDMKNEKDKKKILIGSDSTDPAVIAWRKAQ